MDQIINNKVTPKLGSIVVVSGGLLVMLITLSLYTVKLQRENSLILSEKEVELEAMHSKAYDQGYVSAIWDTYLEKPLYRIVEEDESGEPSLWRKTDVDPVNQKKLAESMTTASLSPDPITQ